MVEYERLLDGVNVATLLLYDTVPLTLPLLLLSVNVLVVMVEEFMSSLNVVLIAPLTATPVALLAGLVEFTVGGVVSVGADVVNDASLPYAVPPLFDAAIR